ncbi:hypothetical protein JCM21142_41761 [Saccharicrinis fermentans DSM 9555 = JCM 21142]|uniref:Uncharacterized protein n=1 Tax=Saccharicrinis fermentans DSM 9555 = JCM 21142 TaxID=869213 RepID=W7Y4T6_9BACT|nr:hypothetical protein JCM21142_41761 [Saccharicrinis fermentans DSM 9555 = JCM 21142]
MIIINFQGHQKRATFIFFIFEKDLLMIRFISKIIIILTKKTVVFVTKLIILLSKKTLF